MLVADSPGLAGARERWLARLALLAALAALVLPFAAAWGRIGVLVAGVVGVVAVLAGAWWFLSSHGLMRWFGAFLVVATPVVVLTLFTANDLLWMVVVDLVLACSAVAVARAALARSGSVAPMPERTTPPPHRPFLVMNPRSGDGKVRRFGLDEKAAALGADVALLDGPGRVDVAALARHAVEDGADLLGVAGGDGTQALVAGIASERGMPFLVISAGTRNHFAMDLGLDREHPDACLDALKDGVELRLDLGRIAGRTFVNNASFGAYAEVVQSPSYREDKRGVTMQMLPDLLSGHRGARLTAHIDGEITIDAPQALLISNNPYEFNDFAGLGRRSRLDTGVLGVIVVTVDSAAEAAGLIRGRQAAGLRRLVAHEVVIEADTGEIPVGIDGEAVMLPTPVTCTIEPGALRVRVPRARPGVPAPRPPLDASQLLHQALATR